MTVPPLSIEFSAEVWAMIVGHALEWCPEALMPLWDSSNMIRREITRLPIMRDQMRSVLMALQYDAPCFLYGVEPRGLIGWFLDTLMSKHLRRIAHRIIPLWLPWYVNTGACALDALVRMGEMDLAYALYGGNAGSLVTQKYGPALLLSRMGHEGVNPDASVADWERSRGIGSHMAYVSLGCCSDDHVFATLMYVTRRYLGLTVRLLTNLRGETYMRETITFLLDPKYAPWVREGFDRGHDLVMHLSICTLATSDTKIEPQRELRNARKRLGIYL